MDSLSDVIEHLLLAAARERSPEPTVTASQVAQASGQPLREVQHYLDALVRQGTLRRVPYRVADCPHCHSLVRVPAPLMVGWEVTAAPPVLLRLTAVWCPTCQRMLPSSGLRAESAYIHSAKRPGAAG